jgi:hypothetical protein
VLGARLGGTHDVFDLPGLDLFLAPYAVGRPRQGFQAFIANGIAAVETLAEAALVQALERQAHQGELGMAFGALGEEHFFLVREDGLIGDIEGIVGDRLAALRHGMQHRVFELLLLVAERFFKARTLLVIGWTGHNGYNSSGNDDRQP